MILVRQWSMILFPFLIKSSMYPRHLRVKTCLWFQSQVRDMHFGNNDKGILTKLLNKGRVDIYNNV
jgi:hypothetical protein